MCSQQYFHYDSKRDKDAHNEWKPYRINSVGSYWRWFPVMQCRETSRGGRWGTDSSESPSQDRCFPTFNTYWCQGQRLNTNGFRKTDWWQSTDDYLIAFFPLRTTAQQQRRTMIAFGQDHVKDDWTHLSVNLHPEVLGQDVLTDNPQMKSDQRVRGENITCRARWIKTECKAKSLDSRKNIKKLNKVMNKRRIRGGLNQQIPIKISTLKKIKDVMEIEAEGVGG